MKRIVKPVFLLTVLLFTGSLLPAQWIKLAPVTKSNLTSCDFLNPDTGVVAGENGAVFKTLNGGASWQDISPNTEVNYTSVMVRSRDTLFVSGNRTFYDGSIVTVLYATSDGGKNWQIMNSYDEVAEQTRIKFVNDDLYLLGPWKGLQKSVNKGVNWNILWKGGGNIILDHLIPDNTNPESLFVFGNIGGFATYSCTFKHALKGGKWYSSDPFDFGSSAAFTSCHADNDTILLFQNFNRNFYPDDTSNILIMLTDLKKDDIIPGANTGDTVWHFNAKIINGKIRHYVQDSWFLSNTGSGYTVDLIGNINKTDDGGITWDQVYTGKDTLNAICMVSDTAGYVIGNKGTVVKLRLSPSGINEYLENNPMDFAVYPSPANDQITIATFRPAGESTVTILNEVGQELIKRPMKGNRMIIDISSLMNGIYFILIQANTKFELKKIIKH